MRLALLGIIGVAASACSWDSTNFDYQSTLYQRTNGVALKGYDGMYGGNRAQVGMNTLTCEVDLATAMLGNDYDYSASDSDQVTDAGMMDGSMVVLVTTPDYVHVQHSGADLPGADTFNVPGVTTAQVSADDVVAMFDDGAGCSVKWVGADVSTPFASSCRTDFSLAVDPVSGGAFIGSADGVSYVTPEGTQVLTEEASELVAWDATAQVLYSAEVGSMILRGLEADGTVRFSTDLGASIQALDDMGTRGAAIVSVSFDDGAGGLIVVDGLTGEIETDQTTPSAISSIVGSPDGGSIALVDVDQVHFYRVGSFLGAGEEQQNGGLDPILGF